MNKLRRMRPFRTEGIRIGIALLGVVVIVAAWFTSLLRLLSQKRSAYVPRLLSVIGLPVGLSVGVSSAGAGSLGTAALSNFTKREPAAVVGTGLLFGFVLSAVGGYLQLAQRNCDFAVLIEVTMGGLIGVTAGSYLCGVLPAHALRKTVLGFAAELWATLLGEGLGKAY